MPWRKGVSLPPLASSVVLDNLPDVAFKRRTFIDWSGVLTGSSNLYTRMGGEMGDLFPRCVHADLGGISTRWGRNCE